MKKAIISTLIIISSLLVLVPEQGFVLKSTVHITGTWNLGSYMYNRSGSQMQFYFVQNVHYVFEADSAGKIIDNADTTNFKWFINKSALTLEFASETKNYEIISSSRNRLMIVDQGAGTDEYGPYTADEKGLMLEK